MYKSSLSTLLLVLAVVFIASSADAQEKEKNPPPQQQQQQRQQTQPYHGRPFIRLPRFVVASQERQARAHAIEYLLLKKLFDALEHQRKRILSRHLPHRMHHFALPTSNLISNKDSYTINLDVHRYGKRTLKLMVCPHRAYIHAAATEGRAHRSLYDWIHMRDPVDTHRVKAVLQNGMLKVTMPKHKKSDNHHLTHKNSARQNQCVLHVPIRMPLSEFDRQGKDHETMLVIK